MTTEFPTISDNAVFNGRLLTDKDLKVLKVLQRFPNDFLGPTEIGLKLGKTYTSASAYCNKSLKRLQKAGLILNGLGKYRALFTNEIH